MSRRLGLVALVAAALGLVAVIVWVARQPRGDAVTPPEDVVVEPEDENGGISFEAGAGEVVHRDEAGEVVWRAKFGGSITLDEQQRRLRHTDVVWELERDGITDLSVTAPVMEADYDSRLLTFSEGVDITAYDGRARFVVDDVRYEFDTGKLIGEGEVAFMYGGFALRGSQLVIDNRNKKVRVRNGTLSFDP